MAKKHSTPPGTPKEQELGRVIATRARVYGSGELSQPGLSADRRREIFLHAYGKAAQEQGYRTYADLPEGVRKFIAWMGGINSRKRRKEKDTAGPSRLLQINEEIKEEQLKFLSEAATEWYDQAAKSPLHSYHPDDIPHEFFHTEPSASRG